MKDKCHSNLPFVSICTPTFNRRPFIPSMIKCFEHQDYPKERMEWIIIDDGTDKIEDLVTHIPQVKYFKYDKKMTLGQKRNLMHDKCNGDIFVYMDDDDYYPPERVSHAVNMLMETPNALCAGSSIIYIWFKHIHKMWQFGPYGPNHATAGTFAFKKELLKITRYNDNAALAEESEFLKGYTIPFVQLDPLKSILCFSHQHNTFDKKKLLDMPNPTFSKPVDVSVEDIVKNTDLLNFYKYDIDKLLEEYFPGKPEMKPDVLKQMEEIEKKRQEQLKKYKEQQQQQTKGSIVVKEPGKPPVTLTNDEVVGLLSKQTEELNKLSESLINKDRFIELMKNKIKEQEQMIVYLKKEIDAFKQSCESNHINIGIKDSINVVNNSESELLNEINQYNHTVQE